MKATTKDQTKAGIWGAIFGFVDSSQYVRVASKLKD